MLIPVINPWFKNQLKVLTLKPDFKIFIFYFFAVNKIFKKSVTLSLIMFTNYLNLDTKSIPAVGH